MLFNIYVLELKLQNDSNAFYMVMLKLEQKVEELERGIKELQKELESEKVVLICVLDFN